MPLLKSIHRASARPTTAAMMPPPSGLLSALSKNRSPRSARRSWRDPRRQPHDGPLSLPLAVPRSNSTPIATVCASQDHLGLEGGC